MYPVGTKEGNSVPCLRNLVGGRTTVSEMDSDHHTRRLGSFILQWPGAGLLVDESTDLGTLSPSAWRKQGFQLLLLFLLGFLLLPKKEFQGMADLSAAGLPINKSIIKEKSVARCGGVSNHGIDEVLGNEVRMGE